MRKWILPIAFSALALTACSDEKEMDVAKSSPGDASETVVSKEKTAPANLFEETQQIAQTVLLPSFKDAYLTFQNISVTLDDAKQLSGQITYKKDDFESIYVNFSTIGSITSSESAFTEKDEIASLKDGDYLEIEGGIGVVKGQYFYYATDANSHPDDLKEILDSLSLETDLHKYVDADSSNYTWPEFMPYGEPTQVSINYQNDSLDGHFSLTNQSVSYFNDSAILTAFNRPTTASEEVETNALFKIAGEANAVYDPELEPYKLVANMNDSKSYIIQVKPTISGTQASVFYDKPADWEDQLSTLFESLVKLEGIDVATIQDSTATKTVSNNNVTKRESEGKWEAFKVENEKFYAHGIALGMTQQQVETILGAPFETYKDESGMVEFISNFANPDIKVSYSLNQDDEYAVVDITTTVEDDYYHYILNSTSNMERVYEDDHVASYFYQLNNNEIVYLIPNREAETYLISIMHGDNYFYERFNIER